MLLLWTVVLLAVSAFGRELTIDELITEPRPGDEYVNIQTGQSAPQTPVRLEETAFQTSHHVPQRERAFATAHVRPADLPTPEESSIVETIVPIEVVTSTSVKSSKSKKVHKTRKAEYVKKATTPKKEETNETILPTTINTEEPPITTFSYKTTEEPAPTTYRPTETDIPATTFSYKKPERQEALKTAETRSQQYDVVIVNKPHHQRALDLDSADFIDDEEKAPAGSSNSASSRVNVKKGPNGEDYEYEYVYYYYNEEDDDNSTATDVGAKASPQTSTAGNRYLPTEKPLDEPPRVQYTTINRNPEQNEISPSTTAAPSRSRGRQEPVAEERLPSNTRFPPRGRAQSATPAPSTTTSVSTSGRPRVRLPTLGLLDSSSFKTQASDASIEDDLLRNPPTSRGSPEVTETTIRSRTRTTEAPEHDEAVFTRRGSRVTTSAPVEQQEQVHTRRGSRVTTAAPSSVDEEQQFTRRSSSKSTTTTPQQEEVFTRRSGRITTPAPVVEEIEDDTPEPKVQNSRRPDTTRQVDEEEGTSRYNTPSRHSTQAPATPEMQKAAFDLYAILQQAQNENIHNNFIEATEPVTESITETEIPETSSPSTTTTTTSTTTTTTTTTTEAPAVVPARGTRYKPRGSQLRSRGSTTTTETPTEVSSARTRPRFQAGTRNTPRRPHKEQVDTTAPETNAEPEKAFGGKSRTRSKPSTTTTTSAPDGQTSPSTRGSSLDRYKNRRRRPGDTATTASEVVSSTSAPRPAISRNRPNVRPLRPGPRLPFGGTTTTTTEAPVSAPEGEVAEPETPVSASAPEKPTEEEPAVTTPPGDALTRLKSRPRLRVHAAAGHKPTPAAPPAARRQLVSNLLPKRNKPAPEPVAVESPAPLTEEEQPSPTEAVPQETPVAASPAPTEAPKGLPGLLGRRRPLNRRPGSIYRTNAEN